MENNKVLASRTVYIMKAIAIISVAMAHCTYIDADIQRITDIFGTIGVPIFLITGGLFFKSNQPWKEFMLAKMRRIVLPWLIWGGITYILHIVNDKSVIKVYDYILWILGYKTWLYYVPVILICYFVFNYSTSIKYILSIIGVGICSYVLTVFGFFEKAFFTSCQNPFNWIGFFAIGILLQKLGLQEKVFRMSKTKVLLPMLVLGSLGMTILYFCVSRQFGFTPSYWNCLSIPFELLSCAAIYMISIMIARTKSAGFGISIGKNSYVLFFSHMQIGINVVNILSFGLWNYFHGAHMGAITFVRGFAVIMISYFVFVFMVKKICRLLKLEKLCWVLGL